MTKGCRKMKEIKNTAIITDEEMETLLLQVFDHAMEMELIPKAKKDAHRMNESYFGQAFPDHSPATMLMTGFICGVHEGMRLYAAVNGDEEFLKHCDE